MEAGDCAMGIARTVDVMEAVEVGTVRVSDVDADGAVISAARRIRRFVA